MASSRVLAIAAAAFTLAGAPTSAFAAQEEPTTPGLQLYDCNAEYDNWEFAWTPDWKAWCCVHHGKGCPSTTTETTTTRTQTTTTRRTTTHKAVKLPPADPLACDKPCTFKDETFTCKQRVQWVADNVFGKQLDKCETALKQVQSDCGVCGSCALKFAECAVGPADVIVKSEATHTVAKGAKWSLLIPGLVAAGMVAAWVAALATRRARRGEALHTRMLLVELEEDSLVA